MSEWSRRDASDPPSPRLRRARHRWENREVERSFWESDIEGKTARLAASELGKERVSNGREHMSQSFRGSLNAAGLPSIKHQIRRRTDSPFGQRAILLTS